MGNVRIKEIPSLHIVEFRNVERLRVSEFTGVEPLRIGQIAPAAVHIKELNHIDPISVESLRIDEVRNVEPLRVEQLDVTRLPPVNLSVRQIPAVDLNVKRVPPVSLGLHQEFCLPSSYTVHARLLGVEFLRLQIHGRTMLSPQDRTRREQARTHERSFPEVAAVGNPAIPVERLEESAEVVSVGHCAHSHRVPRRQGQTRVARRAAPSRNLELRAGSPQHHFSMPASASDSYAGGVSSGDL